MLIRRELHEIEQKLTKIAQIWAFYAQICNIFVNFTDFKRFHDVCTSWKIVDFARKTLFLSDFYPKTAVFGWFLPKNSNFCGKSAIFSRYCISKNISIFAHFEPKIPKKQQFWAKKSQKCSILGYFCSISLKFAGFSANCWISQKLPLL